jgi:hypothetical protein
MKAIIFLFGFLVLECWASETAPRLMGERLVQYFSSDEIVKREFANGYFAGIADAAQGKAWCNTWKTKPNEIDASVFHELRELPQERLREKASVLVTETLGKKYPCK